jgi:DNA-binding MarR family transcriptional regulator
MSSHKRELYAELIDEVRRSQAATARFDQAVADALGINRTDMRCLDVLEHAGPLTAGELAARTGLSSGAMTTAIDRLERAGYARRVRDQDDRRRVLVEPTEQAQRLGETFYRAHGEEAARLYDLYTAEQLELLRDFVRHSREFNETQAAALEARNQK